MSDLISVNGTITSAGEARVSPLDRGFLYGDSVYETLRTYEGRLFLLAEHLARLRQSAERLGIPHDRTPLDPGQAIETVVRQAGHPESAVRVILSRGVGEIDYNPERCGAPTLVVHVRSCPALPAEALREGVDVAIVEVQRNAAAALDPAIKSSNLLNNLLAWQAARRLRVFEPILLNPDGRLAEGATSNLFLVRRTRLLTPSLDAGILRGITRDLVLDLARLAGIDVEEGVFTPADLREADEAFLTSTLKGILPIRRCDGWPIREGRPGPLTRRLLELFAARVQAERNAGSEPGSMRR